MKTVFLFIAILVSGLVAKSQDIFFPTKEGTVLEYKMYDKNEKESGMIRYTIINIKKTGDNMEITYLIETTDAKDKPILKNEMTIHKKGDKLYVDMRKFLDSAILNKGGKAPDKLKITGNDLEIPTKLKVGDALPDSKFGVSFKMGLINIKMGATITDRIVESVENVAVQAGSFKAYKITNKMMANAMGINTTTTSAEWLVKDIGMVRSEKYDKKGKLESYTELVSIKE